MLSLKLSQIEILIIACYRAITELEALQVAHKDSTLILMPASLQMFIKEWVNVGPSHSIHTVVGNGRTSRYVPSDSELLQTIKYAGVTLNILFASPTMDAYVMSSDWSYHHDQTNKDSVKLLAKGVARIPISEDLNENTTIIIS